MADSDQIRTDDCCAAPDPVRDPRIASHFDSLVRKRTAGGVLPPMMPVSHGLYEELRDAAALRPTILELGCGSAALAVGLLEMGAQSYDGIDLSPQALDAARRRAEKAGVSDRASFALGDAARLPVTQHEWVLMDRVICCYPDWEALVDNATRAAQKRIAFSVPTSRGVLGLFNRIEWGLENLFARIQRTPCPGYVHSLDKIDARLTAAGFRLLRRRATPLWHIAVWERING
jgi:SAM-dependent methyltransferase